MKVPLGRVMVFQVRNADLISEGFGCVGEGQKEGDVFDDEGNIVGEIKWKAKMIEETEVQTTELLDLDDKSFG